MDKASDVRAADNAAPGVLFVGNSYTYFNDMPSIFASVCAENGVEVRADCVAAGDYSFARFLDPEDEYAKIMEEKLSSGGFDFVVLQEYSHVPASDPEIFFAGAAALCDKIRKAGAKPVFYETWARADGDEILETYGWTHEEEQTLLRAAYEKAGAENGAILVYAGERFSRAYRAGEPVFAEDRSHPTEAGSRLVAEEFYKVLFANE